MSTVAFRSALVCLPRRYLHVPSTLHVSGQRPKYMAVNASWQYQEPSTTYSLRKGSTLLNAFLSKMCSYSSSCSIQGTVMNWCASTVNPDLHPATAL